VSSCYPNLDHKIIYNLGHKIMHNLGHKIMHTLGHKIMHKLGHKIMHTCVKLLSKSSTVADCNDLWLQGKTCIEFYYVYIMRWR